MTQAERGKRGKENSWDWKETGQHRDARIKVSEELAEQIPELVKGRQRPSATVTTHQMERWERSASACTVNTQGSWEGGSGLGDVARTAGP